MSSLLFMSSMIIFIVCCNVVVFAATPKCPYGTGFGSDGFSAWKRTESLHLGGVSQQCAMCPGAMTVFGMCNSNCHTTNKYVDIPASTPAQYVFCHAGQIMRTTANTKTVTTCSEPNDFVVCPADSVMTGWCTSSYGDCTSVKCAFLDTTHMVLDTTTSLTTNMFCPEGYVATGRCLGPFCGAKSMKCTKLTLRTAVLSQFPCASESYVLGVLGDGRSDLALPAAPVTVPGYSFPIKSPCGVHRDAQTKYVLTLSDQRLVGSLEPFQGHGYSSYASNSIGEDPVAMIGSLYTKSVFYVATVAKKLYLLTSTVGTTTVALTTMSSAPYDCKILSITQLSTSTVTVCVVNGCFRQNEPSMVPPNNPSALEPFVGPHTDCSENNIDLADADATVASSKPLYGPVCLVHESSKYTKAYAVESRTGWIRSVFNKQITPELVTASKHLKGATACVYRGTDKSIYITMPTCIMKYKTVTKELFAMAGRCLAPDERGSATSNAEYVAVGDASFISLTGLYIESSSLFVVDKGANRLFMISNLDLNPRGVPITKTPTITPTAPETRTHTFSDSPSTSKSQSPTRSLAPTPTATRTDSPSPDPSASLSLTNSISPSTSMSPSLTLPPTRTATFSPSATQSEAPTGTLSSSSTASISFTQSTTQTHSISPSLTGSTSMSSTAAWTHTVSGSPTTSYSGSPTPSLAPTQTATFSHPATRTPTYSPTFTRTASVSPTDSPTDQLTMTASVSRTVVSTLTASKTMSTEPTKSATRTSSQSSTDTVSVSADTVTHSFDRTRTFSQSLSETISKMRSLTSSVSSVDTDSVSVTPDATVSKSNSQSSTFGTHSPTGSVTHWEDSPTASVTPSGATRTPSLDITPDIASDTRFIRGTPSTSLESTWSMSSTLTASLTLSVDETVSKSGASLSISNARTPSQPVTATITPARSKTRMTPTFTKEESRSHSKTREKMSLSIESMTHSEEGTADVTQTITFSPDKTKSPSVTTSLGTPTHNGTNTRVMSHSESSTMGTPTQSQTRMYTLCELHVSGTLDGTAFSSKTVDPRPRVSIVVQGNQFHETNYVKILDALSVVSSDSSGFGDAGTYAHIKRTSSFRVGRGGRELVISFGWSSDFLTRGGSVLRFDGDMSHVLARVDRRRPEWTTGTTISVSSVTLPPAGVTTALAAAGGAAAASAVVNPSAMMSAQTLALMASFPCLNPAMKKMSKETSWTLSPLGHYVGALGSLPKHLSSGMWNIILLILVASTHILLVSIFWRFSGEHWLNACTKLLHPHFTFVVFNVLTQGTVKSTVSVFVDSDTQTPLYIFLALLQIMVLPGALYAYAAYFCSTLDPDRDFIVYPNRHRLTPLMQLFTPMGTWIPFHRKIRYAMLIGEYVPRWKYWVLMQLTAVSFPAAVTGFQSDATGVCYGQLVAVALMQLLAAASTLLLQPLRTRGVCYTRSLTFALQAMMLLSCIVLPATQVLSIVLQVLTFALYFFLTLEGVIIVCAVLWEGSMMSSIMGSGMAAKIQTDDIKDGTATINGVTFMRLPDDADHEYVELSPRGDAMLSAVPVLRVTPSHGPRSPQTPQRSPTHSRRPSDSDDDLVARWERQEQSPKPKPPKPVTSVPPRVLRRPVLATFDDDAEDKDGSFPTFSVDMNQATTMPSTRQDPERSQLSAKRRWAQLRALPLLASAGKKGGGQQQQSHLTSAPDGAATVLSDSGASTPKASAAVRNDSLVWLRDGNVTRENPIVSAQPPHPRSTLPPPPPARQTQQRQLDALQEPLL
eukprot:PhM_4_TR732/c0_g2_i1/m.100096